MGISRCTIMMNDAGTRVMQSCHFFWLRYHYFHGRTSGREAGHDARFVACRGRRAASQSAEPGAGPVGTRVTHDDSSQRDDYAAQLESFIDGRGIFARAIIFFQTSPSASRASVRPAISMPNDYILAFPKAKKLEVTHLSTSTMILMPSTRCAERAALPRFAAFASARFRREAACAEPPRRHLPVNEAAPALGARRFRAPSPHCRRGDDDRRQRFS